MKLVADDGTGAERIIVVGEAPGAQEEAQGRPFVGPSGWKMNEWHGYASLGRRDCYWTNVVPWRPPNNVIATVSAADMARCIDELHDRLAALHDPVVIVPTGNIALRALTGKTGITKHRGSIYSYEDRKGRSIKVIPTIHPAAVFRTPGWERRCRLDWQRIAGDSEFRELRLPNREHFTRPTLEDLKGYVADVERNAESLAVDIETPGGTITCVGFSYDPAFSITIPTTLSYWKTEAALAEAWHAIKTLCESDVPKVTHNGLFDTFWLEDRDIRLRQWTWDTLALHHAIDATEDHALAYCASVDTREPYWKDEAKDPEEAAKYASNLEAFWVYNGKDACVTRELASTYIQKLDVDGRLDFYHTHYRKLFMPILRMMRTGILMDEVARKRQHAGLVNKIINLQEQITALCGAPLHSTKQTKKQREAGKLPDLSSKKVRTYIFETLRLPVVRKRGTGKPTADEIAVRQMMLRHAKKKLPAPATNPEAVGLAALVGQDFTFEDFALRVLEHRRTRKLMEFLDEGLLDDDGHMRYTFKFNTDSGRFACGKSPTMRRGQRTGRNVQNIDRELRGVFLPEPGCLFLEVDLSQAEDRIVKMLAAAITGNQALRDRARAKPWENDEHRRAGAIIFGKPADAITKSERQIAKPIRHGVNYNEGARTISDVLLKDGVTFTPEECQKALDALHAADPDIREWQKAVRQQVMTHRCLVNSWGRMLNFDYDRLDDDAYRRGYAFIPQSEVPGTLNQYGLIPLDTEIRRRGWKTVIHLQGHDSLLMSCPPSEVWPVMDFLRKSLERPRIIGREPLTIWTEFKMGVTWAGSVEWKRPPVEEEVRAALEKLGV